MYLNIIRFQFGIYSPRHEFLISESARTEGAEAFYEVRIIPQVPQVLIALAGGRAFSL